MPLDTLRAPVAAATAGLPPGLDIRQVLSSLKCPRNLLDTTGYLIKQVPIENKNA